MLIFSHGQDLGFLQTCLLQKDLIVSPGFVFYIDLAMANMAEVNSYIVFSSFFEYWLNSSKGPKRHFVVSQDSFSEDKMSKRHEKKALVVEEEPEVEVIKKVEHIYEDTRCTTGVEPEYKWGEIYRLISHKEVPDISFEELTIYANIEKSSLMKIATRPEIFPCSEVIGWILPRADVTTMILANTAK